MNPIIQLKQTTSIFLVALLLTCLAIPWGAQAVSPAPDGGYPSGNTAEGDFALQFLTTGTFNTALGAGALFSDTAGLQNTATGAGALFSNTADNNTANGAGALFNNTSGTQNTATGLGALFSNIEGDDNTAVGFEALANNFGFDNTAIGSQALFSNQSGSQNTAVGFQALFISNEGFNNTAIGNQALLNCVGHDNIAVGSPAGGAIADGHHNIDIGNVGNPADSGTIRIGGGDHTRTFIAGIAGVNEGSPAAVFINTTNGQLGTTPPASSRRYKKEIKSMDKVSEAILALNPVTFHYKSDKKDTPQFGLIAEEVAEVNPDLIVRDDKGEIYTVRYDAVNAMLLNEFLKEHQKVEAQGATITRLEKQVEVLSAGLQKVSAELEVTKPAPQVAENNQ